MILFQLMEKKVSECFNKEVAFGPGAVWPDNWPFNTNKIVQMHIFLPK